MPATFGRNSGLVMEVLERRALLSGSGFDSAAGLDSPANNRSAEADPTCGVAALWPSCSRPFATIGWDGGLVEASVGEWVVRVDGLLLLFV